ncbi:hypothetical protein ABMA28_002165 [Loxostege sticticalis]|uniref:Galectin n=1 Tax=Loxostege sticticalis TaxID=481309 RepID=A0ABD0SZZ4_LOXSC
MRSLDCGHENCDSGAMATVTRQRLSNSNNMEIAPPRWRPQRFNAKADLALVRGGGGGGLHIVVVKLPNQHNTKNSYALVVTLFPFKMDRPFTIEVLVDEKQTLWEVDGEHYCSYAHRQPNPFAATWVQVAGVRNATLNINKTDIYPVMAPPPIEVPLRAFIDALPESSEPICWRPNALATLSNGVPEGHQLVIHGRLRLLLHSFAIELTDGAREWRLVVLNAWYGAWGPERRQRTARLVPGTQTTFRIIRAVGEWAVYADDSMIGELDYRASPDGVTALRFRGDLYPEQVFLCPATNSPVREE